MDEVSLSSSLQKGLKPPNTDTTAYPTPSDSPAGLLAATMNRPWINEHMAVEDLGDQTKGLSSQDGGTAGSRRVVCGLAA